MNRSRQEDSEIINEKFTALRRCGNRRFRYEAFGPHAEICGFINGGVLSASQDGTIYYWNIDLGICKVVHKCCGEFVSCLECLDNEQIAIGTNAGKLIVLNRLTTEREILANYGGSIDCIQKNDNGVFVCGTRDHMLYMWSRTNDDTFRFLGTFKGHTGWVTAVSYKDQFFANIHHKLFFHTCYSPFSQKWFASIDIVEQFSPRENTQV